MRPERAFYRDEILRNEKNGNFFGSILSVSTS